MRSFDRILVAVFALAAVIIVGVNIFLLRSEDSEQARPYRVEIYRIAAEIERDGFAAVSLAECEYVTNVEIVGEIIRKNGNGQEENRKEDREKQEKNRREDRNGREEGREEDRGASINNVNESNENANGENRDGNGKSEGKENVTNALVDGMSNIAGEDKQAIFYSNIFATDSDYLIREIGGTLYRFDYTMDAGVGRHRNLAAVNIAMGTMLLLLLAVLLFIRRQILRPFEKLSDLPYQLSRGMLTAPLKENKNRFFGRFVWGMDLLRENMEEQKKRALALQRDRETMLLSLSHDIKTPLSAIKLYAKALVKGIYPEKEKQLETAENIGKKADEIEMYVTQITGALREDFLSLSVREGEFYLAKLVQEIKGHYRERLALSGTDFEVGEYANCLIKGDFDRSVEVLQNLMENAIKYGDGKWISLLFSQEENCVLVTVKNSGYTLSAAELPHIFESFWRGSNVGSTPGSGLGLYICRKLMHKMNGEVFAVHQGDALAVTVVFCKVS